MSVAPKFIPKEGTGMLFRNENPKGDTSPQAIGSAMIDGQLYYLSAWTKEGKKGRYQSLSFSLPKEKDGSSSYPYKAKEDPSSMNDDIPF